ncbi:MAG: hypothetical protein U9Q82_08885 [Chloroflexota bacterium]|nr:hypothetical protein [Chloroflexota bacterium]
MPTTTALKTDEGINTFIRDHVEARPYPLKLECSVNSDPGDGIKITVENWSELIGLVEDDDIITTENWYLFIDLGEDTRCPECNGINARHCPLCKGKGVRDG